MSPKLLMKGKLICYTLGKSSHKERSKLKRELFGYIDKSNNTQYQYQRKGILDQIPHTRPIRSVIITKKEDFMMVYNVLKKYGAKAYIFDVVLKKPL